MASIPIYQKQVQEQALPGIRQESIASPKLFAPNGDMATIGQGLSGLGESIGRHAEELQAKEDTATGTQMSADLLNKITDFKIEARNRKGDLARGLPEEADKFFSDTADAALKAAPNDRVKQYLQVFSEQQRAHFHGYIGSHAAEQMDKAAEAGIEAHITSVKNAAAVDPSIADASIKDITTAVRTQLNKKGITDPEAIALATLEQTSSLHAGVINTLLVSNPKQAEAYYGLHKEGIDGELRVKMEKAISNSTRVETAQKGADDLMGLVRTGSMTYDQAEASARKTYSGEDRTAVIQELRSQHSELKDAQVEQEKAQFEPVYKLLGDATVTGRPIARGEMKSILQPLLNSPDSYAKAAKLLDTHNDEIRSEQQSAAAHARAMATSSTDKAIAGLQLKYDMLQNPDKWRNADLKATLIPLVKEGLLRPGDAEEAINLQTQLKKPVHTPEVASLVSASEYLNSRLETAVIDGKAVSGMQTAEKATVKAQAIQTLEPLLQAYQARSGEKANAQDIKQIVDSVFVDKRYRNTFIGITMGDVKSRTEVDLANAPVRVKAQEVRKIPSAIRTRIESALKNNGYEISPDNILEAYQSGKQ